VTVPVSDAAAGRRADDPIDAVFDALADPTRRSLLMRLVHDGPATATELAEGRTITRQAVVKHLQVLAAARLVVSERDGREVRHRADPEPMADVIAWLVGAGAAWDRRVERLRGLSRRG
jgi:DNA-binding transcriptional ArsR family regulator